MFLRIVIIAVVVFLTSCTAPGALMLCADSAIPRPVTNKTFEVKVFDEGGALVASGTIACEKYYDSDCSVRGNHYAYRRLTPFEQPFVIHRNKGDKFELTFPRCRSLMENKNIHLSHFGRKYFDAKTGMTYRNIYYYGEGVMADGRTGFMFYNTNREPVWLGDPFTATRREVTKE